MVRNGIYPTMITPYTVENKVDEDALRSLVRWYIEKGCHGVFAACQSSEIFYLSLKERIKLVEITKQESLRTGGTENPLTVVASGHVSDSIEAQAEELTMIYEAGADVVVLISNRMDIVNSGTSAWIKNLESLLDRLPDHIPLGIYECPTPYKRLLNSEMLKAVKDTGRFVFFKDTCCSHSLMKERVKILEGSGLHLFNANAQTFYQSLKDGGSGYCGIMANFHPELYVWLFENFSMLPEKARQLDTILSMTAFTETLAYPITAKYYLNQYENLAIESISRSCRQEFGEYDRFIMEQLHQLTVICREGLSI